jgi:hypothetical protein
MKWFEAVASVRRARRTGSSRWPSSCRGQAGTAGSRDAHPAGRVALAEVAAIPAELDLDAAVFVHIDGARGGCRPPRMRSVHHGHAASARGAGPRRAGTRWRPPARRCGDAPGGRCRSPRGATAPRESAPRSPDPGCLSARCRAAARRPRDRARTSRSARPRAPPGAPRRARPARPRPGSGGRSGAPSRQHMQSSPGCQALGGRPLLPGGAKDATLPSPRDPPTCARRGK